MEENALVVEICGISFTRNGQNKIAIGYGMRREGAEEESILNYFTDGHLPSSYDVDNIIRSAQQLSEVVKRNMKGNETVRITGGLDNKVKCDIPEEEKLLAQASEFLKQKGVRVITE